MFGSANYLRLHPPAVSMVEDQEAWYTYTSASCYAVPFAHLTTLTTLIIFQYKLASAMFIPLQML